MHPMTLSYLLYLSDQEVQVIRNPTPETRPIPGTTPKGEPRSITIHHFTLMLKDLNNGTVRSAFVELYTKETSPGHFHPTNWVVTRTEFTPAPRVGLHSSDIISLVQHYCDISDPGL